MQLAEFTILLKIVHFCNILKTTYVWKKVMTGPNYAESVFNYINNNWNFIQSYYTNITNKNWKNCWANKQNQYLQLPSDLNKIKSIITSNWNYIEQILNARCTHETLWNL